LERANKQIERLFDLYRDLIWVILIRLLRTASHGSPIYMTMFWLSFLALLAQLHFGGFSWFLVRIAPGRPPETRRRVGQEIFEAACEFLKNVYETTPLAISLEVREIDNTAAFREKNLGEIVKEPAI
jgi:hypothetical protein